VKGDRPLVLSERTLLDNHVPPPPAKLPDLRGLFLAIGLAVAIALLLLARVPTGFSILASLASFALGFGGVVLLSIWAFTEHWSGSWNPHVFEFDPVCLGLLPGFVASRRGDWRPSARHRALSIAVALLGIAGLVLSFFGPGATTRHWIYLALPALLAFVIAPRLRRPA
jgi:hypothetical protein